MRSKSEIFQELEAMLHDVFVARSTGVAYARMARAHGYVDGFMRAMLESGIATKQELLDIVAAQRNSVDGPAVGELHLDEIESAAA